MYSLLNHNSDYFIADYIQVLIQKALGLLKILNLKVMENLHNYSSEELQKCPYHQQLNASADKTSGKHINTGDWGEERDEDGTDPNRYEKGFNNNSGETGSAAANK